MRHVQLGQGPDRPPLATSCVGFGCASLGSRVPEAEGLRALAAAFEQGVTWLDLAPAYGRGAAETIAADFIRGRRDRLRICTKVGLAPPETTGFKSTLIPLARRAVAAIPGLRGAIRRSGTQSNRKLPLTPELLHSSLDDSLRRLGTDHVDLYALHNATPDEIARDDILRALEDILTYGKTRALAVAGDEAVALAAIRHGTPFGLVQCAIPAPGTPDRVFAPAQSAHFGAIAHSIFGVEGALAALATNVATNPAARAQALAATGLTDPQAALAHLLLARAFALNPKGVILASMFSDRSLKANMTLANTTPDPAVLTLIDRLAA